MTDLDGRLSAFGLTDGKIAAEKSRKTMHLLSALLALILAKFEDGA
jgi:hypothetical protein